MRHERVRLADTIDWNRIDGELADRFSGAGRPGTETRFMMGRYGQTLVTDRCGGVLDIPLRAQRIPVRDILS